MSQPVSDEPSLKGKGVARVSWPTLRFYTPLNISGMVEATVVKFGTVVGYIKC